MKQPPVSVDNFKRIIDDDYYYVDKTKVIEELLYNKNLLVLFPRPRRFGKSLLLSMIDCFFNIDKKENNKNLFRGLYIEKSEYYSEFGKYPVIHVDFKSLKRNTYEGILNQFKFLISELYKEKEYVKEILDEDELKDFNLIKSRQGNEDDYIQAIKLLSKWLCRYHKQNVIILIDEYDVPITEAYMNNIYNEVMNFM
ncbi:MAG: AAA family ATPase, partial [Bacilli bacterium]|nr:AAA family ATPase [Bacilli bacterium]